VAGPPTVPLAPPVHPDQANSAKRVKQRLTFARTATVWPESQQITAAEPAAGAVAGPAAEDNHSTSAELEDRSRKEPVVGTTEETLAGAAVAAAPGCPLPDPPPRRPQ
jgi:hypothetical protein